MRTRIISLLAVFLVFISGCAPKEQMPRLIPMEDFFKNPESTGYDLSPDGEHLAFLKPWQNRLNVHVQKIGEEEVTRITGATERDIAGYIWANNERIAYVQDRDSDSYTVLFSTDLTLDGYLIYLYYHLRFQIEFLLYLERIFQTLALEPTCENIAPHCIMNFFKL